jgi:hypothetical protein
MTPHGLGNLLASVTECLDLAREGLVKVDGDRGLGQAEDRLVKMHGHTGDQGDQVRKSENQLLSNFLGDAEQLRSLK